MPGKREKLEELEGLVMEMARCVTAALRDRGVGGLSLTQMRVLTRLAGGIERASDLALSLRVTPAAVTKLLDQLEERGFIARRRSSADRRSTSVSLTAPGREAMERSRKARSETIRRLLRPLRDEESRVLAAVLRRMLEDLPEAWKDAP